MTNERPVLKSRDQSWPIRGRGWECDHWRGMPVTISQRERNSEKSDHCCHKKKYFMLLLQNNNIWVWRVSDNGDQKHGGRYMDVGGSMFWWVLLEFRSTRFFLQTPLLISYKACLSENLLKTWKREACEALNLSQYNAQ